MSDLCASYDVDVYHTPFLQRRNFYWKTINHVMRKIYFTFNFFQFNFLCNGPTSNQVSMVLHKMYFISGFLYNYLLFNIVRYMPFELWQWKVNQFFATSIPNITFLSSILSLFCILNKWKKFLSYPYTCFNI